ncbi:hypothetical protein SAMN05660742_113100 [Propionispira arboris]|uniref:Uncharacterized protein n=1 Tax=Propionispira arboris TaxID=84035 RepID=A0A1H7AQ95_9FIRM|nr:hypothetical protein [Propionispira arboris]SEJ67763.1 hypothetical protein SAMN05660742_113100 [Propionispira arboris]
MKSWGTNDRCYSQWASNSIATIHILLVLPTMYVICYKKIKELKHIKIFWIIGPLYNELKNFNLFINLPENWTIGHGLFST